MYFGDFFILALCSVIAIYSIKKYIYKKNTTQMAQLCKPKTACCFNAFPDAYNYLITLRNALAHDENNKQQFDSFRDDMNSLLCMMKQIRQSDNIDGVTKNEQTVMHAFDKIWTRKLMDGFNSLAVNLSADERVLLSNDLIELLARYRTATLMIVV
ncbi:MAG: hypothetical protein Faunusvirus21_2 [Faunusvirus sp.]|jgi:hypothetical protein|uniref:Uncharacterized protein n=1 Tax=Faunusvirus sp. TaxID=2487766 RepID=A0A3G4ZX94_9VIRU|nr:MAG: hypothetical protein Faunusvirus21_2 [Faunusvirus sp.]